MPEAGTCMLQSVHRDLGRTLELQNPFMHYLAGGKSGLKRLVMAIDLTVLSCW